MPAGNLSIEIDGDELKAVKSYQNLSKEQRDLVGELGKVGAAAERAASQAIDASKKELATRREQNNAALRLVKANESIADSHQREVLALETARSNQIITNKQYETTLARIKEKYEENTKAAKTSGDAAVTAHDEEVKSALKLVAANKTIEQSYNEELKALKTAVAQKKITTEQYEQTLKGVEDKYKRIKKQGNLAFGSSAVNQIAQLAAGWATFTGIVNISKRALEYFNEEKDKAADVANTLAGSRTSLRQVSNGDFDELQGRADALASDSSLGITRTQAQELLFAARSTGFEGAESERFVASVDVVIPVEEAAKFAGEFRQQFSGDGLSIENAFDTALAAAANSVYNINQLLPQIANAAQGSKAIGASSSDVAAVTSVFAGQFGQSAGQRVRSLQENILAQRDSLTEFQDKDLIEVIKLLRDNSELRSKFVGANKELGTAVNAAVNSLQDFELDGVVVPGILNVDKTIEAAQTDAVATTVDKVSEALNTNTRSGKIEVARRASIASQSANEIATEYRLAEESFQVKTQLNNIATNNLNEGAGLAQRAGSAALGSAVSNVTSDASQIQYASDFGSTLFSLMTNPFETLDNYGRIVNRRNEAEAKDERISKRLEELEEAKRQTGVLESINDNLERQPLVNGV